MDKDARNRKHGRSTILGNGNVFTFQDTVDRERKRFQNKKNAPGSAGERGPLRPRYPLRISKRDIKLYTQQQRMF